MRKPRAGDAGLPTNVHAADGCGNAPSNRKSPSFQGHDRRRPRRGPVYAIRVQARADGSRIRSLRPAENLRPAPRSGLPRRARRTGQAMINLVIEHVITADMPDGQPLPPFYEHDAIWHLVDRFHDQKKTLWRRISIQTNTTSPSTAPLGHLEISLAAGATKNVESKKYSS